MTDYGQCLLWCFPAVALFLNQTMTIDRPSSNDNGTLTLSAKASRSGTRSRARYLSLCDAIRKTRDELADWQSRVDRIMTNFNVQIRPRELRLTDEVQSGTRTLIEHAERTMLDQSHAALLHLWIVDNLASLEHHPFADKAITDALQQRWYRYVYTDRDQPHKSVTRKPTLTNILDDEMDDELDDDDIVFNFSSSYEPPSHQRHGERKQADSQRTANHYDERDNPQSNDESNNKNSSTDDTSAHVGSTTERVFGNALSIDQLFRPLARILHPDREQDETRKAEKHALMSECLQARERNDIDTLLTLYIEHIGDLPKSMLADSHDDLIRLLERQLKQEQLKLRRARFNSGFEHMLLDRYQRNDEAAEQLAFRSHAASLDAEISRLSEQHERIKDESELMSALQHRKLIEQDRLSISRLTGA